MDRLDKPITRRKYLAMMAGVAAATLAPRLCRGENGKGPLRLAISVETLGGANVNDARAAYRVWLHEVQDNLRLISIEAVPDIFIPSEELIRNIRQGMLDGYVVTALELAKVTDFTNPDSILIEDYLAEGMEYVLLVHNNSPFKKVADLRGARIVSHLHRDMVLLPAWLCTVLAANGLPQSDQFFSSHQLVGNLNQVILPLFFRRVDGVCIARRSWETAVELNPQIGRDLRAVAVSPTVIPIIFAFRCSTIASARKALIDSIQRIYAATTGQQIIALYQSSGVVVKPISVMKSTLEMVHQFERMPSQLARSRKGAS